LNCHLYLRKGTLFVPTTGKVDIGLYRDIEPVAVVDISNSEGMREALHATVLRGNPPTPHFSRGNYPPPAVLKHAGVKTWSAFAREARSWSIQEDDRGYRIVGYRKDKKGYWVEDPEQTTEFPPAAKVDDVIDRMIAILQEAAQNNAPLPTVLPNRPADRSYPLPVAGDNWVRLPPGPERIDELADFVEWMANAKPEDEQTIRAEIKRYFYDVGDQASAAALNDAFTVLLRPDLTREARQSILDRIDVFTRTDPRDRAHNRD
jgi:hypothetical protein